MWEYRLPSRTLLCPLLFVQKRQYSVCGEGAFGGQEFLAKSARNLQNLRRDRHFEARKLAHSSQKWHYAERLLVHLLGRYFDLSNHVLHCLLKASL